MSVEVKTPTRSQFEHSEFPCGEKTSNFTDNVGHKNVTFSEKSQCFPNPRDYNPHKGNPSQFRKRKTSFRNETHQQFGGYRRKRAKSMPAAESNIVLPTKFLLGGNINDPLNLNSLNNEEVNAILNENTPQASPIVTPPVNQSVSVPVPCNINDPLNLDTSDDVANKRKKRNKHHKKKGDEVNSNSVQHVVKESEKRKGLLEALKIEVDDPQTSQTSTGTSQSSSAVTSQHLNELKPLEIHFSSKPKADKIVSPVIPQSSPRLKRRRRAMSMSDAKPESLHAARSILRTSLSPPKSSAFEIEDQKVTLVKHSKRHNSQKQQNYKKHPKFVYGNYNRYYGYRNPDAEKDQRMFSFKREWFEGKDVLDIGCNVGHLTLAIGKDFKPNKIIGMDIDKSLIAAARKNIRHYLSSQLTGYDKFPVSSSLTYGPISAPPILDPAVGQFPQNVAFFQGNYVLESDELLELQREEYDAILALSLTKWIHLNFGDAGLKRFFKRIFKHLRPGGKLVLEPQPWSSYKKKKKLTEEIHKNFQSIQLKPAQFSDYLLSKEVGFSTCEVVDIPCHKAKGFRRPIQLYTKPDTAACSPKIDSTVSSSVVESSKSTSAIQSNKKQDFASSPKSDSDKSDKALGSLSSSNNSSSPLNTNSEEKTLETNSESKSVEQNTTDGSSEKGN